MKRDRCGVCGGDNGSCTTFSGTYNAVEQGDYPALNLTLLLPVLLLFLFNLFVFLAK